MCYFLDCAGMNQRAACRARNAIPADAALDPFDKHHDDSEPQPAVASRRPVSQRHQRTGIIAASRICRARL